MKKLLLLVIFILLWTMFIVFGRDLSENNSDELENDYQTDFEHFNRDYYDNN